MQEKRSLKNLGHGHGQESETVQFFKRIRGFTQTLDGLICSIEKLSNIDWEIIQKALIRYESNKGQK